MNENELRFWSKVRIGDDVCWEWTGTRHRDGYGKFKLRGRMLWAHRIAWELEHGEVSAEACVCHHCDNPACVRPSHLYLGTQRDNMRDMSAKGRSAAHQGERNPRAKLTRRQADAIRADRHLTQSKLACLYGVSVSCVQAIKSGRTWQGG